MLGKFINICTNIKFHKFVEFNANMCIINRRTDFAEFARWWIMRQDGGGEDHKTKHVNDKVRQTFGQNPPNLAHLSLSCLS